MVEEKNVEVTNKLGNDPRAYGAPEDHDRWRPLQKEAAEWILNNGSMMVLEAPTGSGKTMLVKVLGSQQKTASVCKTKNLQVENYQKTYGFDVLMGRGNYECIEQVEATTDHCEYDNMKDCPSYNDCLYVIARNKAYGSQTASFNYALYFYIREKIAFTNLVLDEAHDLSDIVLDHAGLELTNAIAERWDFPGFPLIKDRSKDGCEKSVDHLEKCLPILRTHVSRLKAQVKADENWRDKRALAQAENLQKKIEATVEAMQISAKDWYVRSGPHNGQWSMFVKPLTARYHAPHYFGFNDDAVRTLAMSATIGNIETFCGELGIENYSNSSLPNPYPVEARPIYDLGAPPIGQKTQDSGYIEQARVIANAIKGLDSNWPGLILVKSRYQAKQLERRLGLFGLAHRLFLMPELPTDKQIGEWQYMLQRKPNAICISWNLWEGYDGVTEKFVIIAKVPYPYRGDPFEQRRQARDGKFYFQRTAWQFMQGLGRVRRNKHDYDQAGRQGAFVGIADANWKRIRNYMSPHILESVREL